MCVKKGGKRRGEDLCYLNRSMMEFEEKSRGFPNPIVENNIKELTKYLKFYLSELFCPVSWLTCEIRIYLELI